MERKSRTVSRLQGERKLEIVFCSGGTGSMVMGEGQRKASAGGLGLVLGR